MMTTPDINQHISMNVFSSVSISVQSLWQLRMWGVKLIPDKESPSL